MSCYFRHLKGILEEAGIEVNAGNRKQLDQAMHQLLNVNYKDCPAAWKRLKEQIMTDKTKREDFIIKLKETFRA